MALAVNLLVFLSESHAAEGGSELSPLLIGAATLGILLAALLVVLAIGGGRDHS